MRSVGVPVEDEDVLLLLEPLLEDVLPELELELDEEEA